MKKINLIVEKTSTGFSAYAEDLPVFTTGRSMTQLKENILEAVNLYKDETGEKLVSLKDINVTLDLPQFFEYYKVINAKALSERVGMNQSLLAQYVGGQKKPSSKQVDKILNGIRELGKELSELQLVQNN